VTTTYHGPRAWIRKPIYLFLTDYPEELVMEMLYLFPAYREARDWPKNRKWMGRFATVAFEQIRPVKEYQRISTNAERIFNQPKKNGGIFCLINFS
jgi:hypothetical protein